MANVFAQEAEEEFIIDENGVLTYYEGIGGDVVIPEGVTKIGDAAFSGCIKMISVIIPDTITNIPDYVFSECSNLTIIKGIEGSYAETYTNENGYEFVEFDYNNIDFIVDLDENGKVNLYDVKMLLRIAVGIDNKRV